MTIYKIVPAALWRERGVEGRFRGSPVDLADGFIHFSTARQVAETAAKHFSGISDLLIVAVDVEAIAGPALRWEPSSGGDLFPHLYCDLTFDGVRWVKPLPLGTGRRHLFPDLDPMRVYLACTVRGDRAGVAAGRAIAERLEAHGHEVLTKHLLLDDVEVNESKLSDDDIYRRDIEWVSTCDILVAEASGSSYGVGFEVGFVLGRSPQSGQRALVLYDAGRGQAISRLITGNAHPACRTVGYGALDELRAAVDDFVRVDPGLPRSTWK